MHDIVHIIIGVDDHLKGTIHDSIDKLIDIMSSSLEITESSLLSRRPARLRRRFRRLHGAAPGVLAPWRRRRDDAATPAVIMKLAVSYRRPRGVNY